MENPTVYPIVKLLNKHFYVPHYQRGYRWEKQQVTDLLDDILKYQTLQRHLHPFYNLQSIEVKQTIWTNSSNEKIDGWEVIDGQQRLITILLILEYLATAVPEQMKEMLVDDNNFYTIYFETRDDSKEFFENKKYKYETDNSNIDYYHISKAYQHIYDWFDKTKHLEGTALPNNMLSVLLGEQQNVSFIWYEYTELYTNKEEHNNPISLYTRLNLEKAVLNNAQLIRALFLQSDIYPSGERKFINQNLSQIALEWDEIETKLRDDRMWYFINDSSYQPSSRIEIIFKMLAEKWNDYQNQLLVQYNLNEGKPKYFSYMVFENHLEQVRRRFSSNISDQSCILDPINDLWWEVKNLFNQIEEWYNHHTLYHYIGFLFATNKDSYRDLLQELTAIRLDKDKFEAYLKLKIAEEIKLSKQLNELTIDNDSEAIVKLLLLVDVEIMVNNEQERSRLPFHLYKKENINTLVHINPQMPLSTDSSNEEEAMEWLQHHKQSLTILNQNYLKGELGLIDQLLQQIEGLLNKYNKEAFEKLLAETIELNNKMIGMLPNEMHTLSNLVLTDQETSALINSSFFDVKRKILKKLGKNRYIPINTQRVFSKQYSENPRDMYFWNRHDKEYYLANIQQVYDSYVQLLEKNYVK